MKQQQDRAPGAGRQAARTKRPTRSPGRGAKRPAAFKPKSKGRKNSLPRPKAARPPVANPGGYRVLDGTVPAKRGKPPEIGRIVRVGGKFEAWRKVEGGYARIGAFEHSYKAIEAVGTAR